MDPVSDTPAESVKPASVRGPNWARNKARRERQARGGSRSQLSTRPAKRPAVPRLEKKRAARVEAESSSLDWMKADYKAKRHKFMLAYNTLEDLQPRIEELLERIRKIEPQFEVTHHGRRNAETDMAGVGTEQPVGEGGADGGGVGVPGVQDAGPQLPELGDSGSQSVGVVGG